MLKEKDLTHVKQTRFQNGSGVTNETLCETLMALAEEYAIPVAMSIQELKIGGTLKARTVSCLTLYHPNHPKDYGYYVFKITHQGTYAFVDVSMGGNSPNLAAAYVKDNLLNYSLLSPVEQGRVIGLAINATAHGALFRGKSKREEENNWYTMMKDVIEEVLGE